MGILQAGILERVAMPSSRGSSQPRNGTQDSHIANGFFTIWATGEASFKLCKIIIHIAIFKKKWKGRKWRNTWSNRQIWPWSTEWGRAKANRVLPREHTGYSKHPLPTTQERTLHMDITRWLTLKSDWLYSLQWKIEKLYSVSKNKTGSWLWLRSWTPYCQIQTEIEGSGEKH